MSGLCRKAVNYFYRVWKGFAGLVVRDVPDEFQSCEFDCRKVNCSMGDWDKCEMRLRHVAQIRKPT
jgi:hypothetical protein